MPHTDAIQLQTISQNAAVAIVHLVGADEDAEQRLGAWLAAAGLDLRSYVCLQAYLEAQPAERPSCLVVDADAIASVRADCPIVATAYRADVATAVNAMKRGAIDFVEKPLREAEIMAAVHTAIDADRRRRLAASRTAELHERFAKLSPRERQVMALVTTGRLNKQVGGDLGLSEITIKAHRGAAMRKMGARSIADLVRMADAIGDEVVRVRSGCSAPARTAAAWDPRSGCSWA